MNRKSEKIWFWIFVGPALFFFIYVVAIPFIYGIYLSFFKWDGIGNNPMTFVGLDNYINVFKDSNFIDSGIRTLFYTIVVTFTINALALLLALAVTQKVRGSNLARTFFFAPNLIGGLILGFTWKFIFSTVFVQLGKMTGMENIFFNYLINADAAIYALIIVSTWSMSGYMMIIYIAGLQGIPTDVIEASQIDGANGWQRFKGITFPLLAPAITTCLFLTLSNSFKIYDVNLSLTNGGPGKVTEMISMNIVNEIFSKSNYGYGQAKAIIFFFVVALITLTQVYISKKREENIG